MDVGVGCMKYFGVRSYLDNFYDRRDENERQRNNQSQHPSASNRPRFSSRWWKIMLWFGSILVLSGFFLLLIGFILPRKKINVNSPSTSRDSQILIVDRQAIIYNANLDTSHLIGICLVVAGGILFTLSLLMPTFCYMWCATGESNDETDPLKLRMEASSGEQAIPVRSVPKSIQPNNQKNQSRVTTQGIVPMSSP